MEVQTANQKYFDEFSAPDALVIASLTAEAAGVTRNGLSIPAACVRTTSSAAVGLSWAMAPCYCLAGVIMAVAGGILLSNCYTDFKNAFANHSLEEKWRSSLNLFDKCLLIALGVALCVIGTFKLAALIAKKTAVTALAISVIATASIVFATVVTLRGIEMIARGGYGLWKANQFQKTFQDCCAKGCAAQWLSEEHRKDPSALKNRIGQAAFDLLHSAPMDPLFANAQNYEQLMKRIHEGICEERVKQQLFLSIGTAMVVGGVLFLAAVGLSHGAAAPAVVTTLGIAGSGFSLSMEALWMPYDHPKWFKNLALWRYRKQEQQHPLQFGSYKQARVDASS